MDVWAILKGTPNADLCRKFIRFTCDPKRQAAFTKYLTDRGVTPPPQLVNVIEPPAYDNLEAMITGVSALQSQVQGG